MGTKLRRVKRRRKLKVSPRRNKTKEFFQMVGCILLLLIFAIAGSVEYDPTGYVKGKKIFKEPAQKTVQDISGKKFNKKKPQKRRGKKKCNICEEAIRKYFPKYAQENAIKIARCESGLDPKIVNWEDAKIPPEYRPSVGCMSIRALDGRPSLEELKDAETNIKMGVKLWKESGNRFGSTLGWYHCARKLGIY